MGLSLNTADSTNSGTLMKISSSNHKSSYSFTSLSSNPLTLPSIFILSSGNFTFTLTPSSFSIPSNTSNEFTSTNFIKSFNFTVPSISNYFDFAIDFEVFGDDDNHFLGTSSISIKELSDLGVIGDLVYETETGELTTSNLYFLGSGSANLSYTVGTDEDYSEFTVTKSTLNITFDYPVINI